MRYIPLLVILLLTSCSPQAHLKLSERHRLIAISKGAKVSPDTVHVTKTVLVPIKGLEDSTHVKPTIDTSAFIQVIGLNDSLFAEKLRIEQALAAGMALDKEKAIASLQKVNRDLSILRKRIAQGFSKDSVYVHKPDSVTEIGVEVKNGLVNKITYSRKDTTVKQTITVPVWIEQAISAGFQKWHLIALIGGALVVGLIVGLFLRTEKEK